MKVYHELKENNWGITKENYDNLPTNSKGVKIIKCDMPNGTNLEVFDEETGTIVAYAEAFQGLWYER